MTELTLETFEEMMEPALERLQPLMIELSRQNELVTSVTIGMLIGAFLTTRKTAEDREDVERLIQKTLYYVDKLQLEKLRTLQ